MTEWLLHHGCAADHRSCHLEWLRVTGLLSTLFHELGVLFRALVGQASRLSIKNDRQSRGMRHCSTNPAPIRSLVILLECGGKVSFRRVPVSEAGASEPHRSRLWLPNLRRGKPRTMRFAPRDAGPTTPYEACAFTGGTGIPGSGSGAGLPVQNDRRDACPTKALNKTPYLGNGVLSFILFAALAFVCIGPALAEASAYQFLRLTTPGSFFAIDPDLNIRRINPAAPSNLWTVGEGWGLPPLFYYTRAPGNYERVDFLYPFGFREESNFLSKMKLQPVFESRWSKIPPFDGFSRCLTLYHGRSDLGQAYWGFFPFYGYSYRRWGVDKNLFVLFPLYYESTDDDARTIRILWPIGTFARSPGRSSFKIWPLIGRDAIRNDYFNRFVLWPFFQWTDKYPGTEQAYSYRALPFPLYMTENDAYSCTTHFLWPFITYYHHYRTGHTRYSLRPLITYGTGGGIDELSLLFLYSYKKDWRKATTTNDSQGYISVQGDEVVTEQSFLKISKIRKHYRKGSLVFARYLFWPFADYSWSLSRGSHLKVPCLIPMKSDWWDLNLGRLLRFVDFRDTPITRELSLLFGLSRRTELKSVPHIPPPPKPGDDGWSELISGAFGKR